MEHWIHRAMIYHVYPLGFCGCPEYNEGGAPVPRLDKLREWIPHWKDLGVDTLYLGPVCQSVKHGYDTTDYYQIDCRLGDNDRFAALCDLLHQNGIRVVLDGVFNHVGRGFWAFRDVQERGSGSPYCSWFQNLNFGGSSPLGDPFWYESWGGHYELVKLNLRHPEVRDHLLGAVGMWMDRFHIDGLRLDAADCVDPDFFRALRAYTKARDPEFWLMGEIIHGDYARWANPELLDSVTNYECWKGNWSAHNTKNYFEIAHSLDRQFGPGGIYRGLTLYNFTENHDVDRLSSTLIDRRHLFNVYTLLYTMPGVPSLYYGGEWAVEGKRTKWSDVDLRPALDLAEMERRDQSLCAHLAKLAQLRSAFPALRTGDYQNVVIRNEQLVFRRATADQRVYVLLNLAGEEASLEFPHSEPVLQDVLNRDQIYHNDGGRTWLTLPPCSAMVLVGAPDRFSWRPEAPSAPAAPPPSPSREEPAPALSAPPQGAPAPSAAQKGHVLVVLADPGANGLCASIAQAAEEALRERGWGVWAYDLYAQGFDPVLTPEEASGTVSPLLAEQRREAREAAGILVIHPDWHGQPPALLTGWVQRVLQPPCGEEAAPALQARAALVFNTAPAGQEPCFDDALQRLWRDCVFGPCKIQTFDRCVFPSPAPQLPPERSTWREEVQGMVAAYFPS